MRVVTGLAICLAIIIAAGIFININLASSSDRMTENINRVEKLAKESSWAKAKEELNSMENMWSSSKKTWPMLIDHIEIDNIDASLSKADKYIETRDLSLLLGEISALRLYIRHIPEREAFVLKNIL